MTNAQIYAAAVTKLADTGVEDDILFERVSDADASTLAWMAQTNPQFRANVIAAQARSGMVDTFVVTAANA